MFRRDGNREVRRKLHARQAADGYDAQAMWKPLRRLALLLAVVVTGSFAAPDAAAGKPRIKLLKAGKGKRQVLRYMLTPGTRGTMILETDMTSTTGIAGMKPMVVKLPTMVMTLQLVVGQQLPRGELNYTFELTDATARKRAGVPDYLLPILNKALAGTKGVTGSAIINERGFNRNTVINVPATAPAQVKQTMAGMQQSMESMASPLPAQPVGIGARWKLYQTVSNQGMKLQQVTEFRVVRLWPHQVELATRVTQTARPQTLTLPTGTARLTRYRATGKGTVIIDLRRLVPRSRMTVRSDYTVQVGTAGSGQRIKASIDLAMRIHRK